MHPAEAKDRAERLSTFRCNICGGASTCDPTTVDREDASCTGCGSSVRLRAIVHLLSVALFEESMPLGDFPVRPDLYGFGLSDWSLYAKPLARRFSYVNTFYHTAPRLDITDVPDELAGSADFLIATDVFEHVLSPVERAFHGARRLLREGGVFVFSVPFHVGDGGTVEHFPSLHDFSLEGDVASGFRLRNRLPDGAEEVFEDLVFHGGPGSTLEMRVFSRDEVVRHFREAGFRDVQFAEADEPRWGIHWTSPFSRPLVARA